MVCELSGLHLEQDANNVVHLRNTKVIATILLEQWIACQGTTSPLDGEPLDASELAQVLCYASNVDDLVKMVDSSRKNTSTVQKCVHPKAIAFQRQLFQRHAMSKFLQEVLQKDHSVEVTELKMRVLFAAYIREFPTQFLNDLVQLYKTLVAVEKSDDAIDKPGFQETMILRSHCRTIFHNYLTKPLAKLLEIFEEPIHALNQDLQFLVHNMFVQSFAQNLEQTLHDLESSFEVTEIVSGSYLVEVPLTSNSS